MSEDSSVGASSVEVSGFREHPADRGCSRRRSGIERNIHDGGQQQPAALAVQAKLAENPAGTDADKQRELVRGVQQGLQDALDDLRDLARGICPPLLADQGLRGALQAQARRAPMPVEVEVGTVERYPQEVEAATYFCILEAMQNVAKYAEASNVTVRVRRTGPDLASVVRDDGRGFDPGETGYGTGLQGMADRLAALGGSLVVRSAPGEGTTIEGSLPSGA